MSNYHGIWSLIFVLDDFDIFQLGKILQKKNRSPNILKNLNITYIVLFWNYFFCSAFLSTFNKFIHNGILLSIKLFK